MRDIHIHGHHGHLRISIEHVPVVAAQLVSVAMGLLLLEPVIRSIISAGSRTFVRTKKITMATLMELKAQSDSTVFRVESVTRVESVARSEMGGLGQRASSVVKQSAGLHSLSGIHGAVEVMEIPALTSDSSTAAPLTMDSIYSEVIEDLEGKDLEALRKSIKWRHVGRFMSVYGIARAYEDYAKYEDVNVLEVFSKSFEEKLRADPFYHVDRPYDADKFYYREQAWHALGSTMRRKYKIARVADKALLKARAATTASYETSGGGMSIKASPGIGGIDGDDFSLRLQVKRVLGIDSIDTKIGRNDFLASIAKRIHAFGEGSRICLEYEINGDYENDGEQEESISRVCLEIPTW